MRVLARHDNEDIRRDYECLAREIYNYLASNLKTEENAFGIGFLALAMATREWRQELASFYGDYPLSRIVNLGLANLSMEDVLASQDEEPV